MARSAANACGVIVLCALVATAVQAATVIVNPHNGMTFFYNEPHKTVPRDAEVASLETAVDCICSDADPRDESLLVTTNCYHQALYGNCQAEFMSGALEELVEADGFCQMSCNNCTCCDTPWNIIQKTGNTRFLQAVTATNSTLERMLKSYGWTSTVLVPSDAAFDAALADYSSVLQSGAVLTELLKFHILPPEPRTRGLWTTPFMAVGATMSTLFDGTARVTSAKTALPSDVTAYGGLTGIKLTGPVNSATITASDIRACKTYVTVIDAVLWPFDPKELNATTNAGPLAAAVGAGACSVVPNSVVNATTLVAGASNTQASPADCCASCTANAQCNTWSYCGLPGGCRFPNGDTLTYGYCELKHSDELAAGKDPLYGDSGIDVVPVMTGFSSSQTAATTTAG